MTQLPGIGGSLFPAHFLASRTAAFAAEIAGHGAARRHHFAGWWRQVEATCGPATGLRALFDLVAMPMAGMLGYRARDAEFCRDVVRVRLERQSSGSVQLIVLPWATRPSRRLRDLHATSAADAGWAIVIAAPFVSVIDMRGHAFRRGVEFRLPDAIDPRSFPAFWRICHAGNLLTPAGTELLAEAAHFQDRVRDDLQAGVVEALGTLAPALVSRGTKRPADAPFGEALTLVYRILFLLFAESRAAAPSGAGPYGSTYAISSLCRDACSGGDRAAGLWEGLGAITRLSRSGCDAAGFAAQPFNGRLFARSGVPALENHAAPRPTRDSLRRDAALARALTVLATRPGAGGRQTISYADLGVEQLGAVYEKVLDLDPAEVIAGSLSGIADRSRNVRQHSTRRKESGTFYTPQPLAEFVVRRTLAPLVRNASADEILELRVVDPAMGSGAFLVAACRFLSDAYERALLEEGRCAETDLDANARAGIRRLVASRCLAGVDANPVAVQLARLSLWLTTLAREKPLSFFDHQLRCGNSLVGASPEDLWRLKATDRRTQHDTPLFEAAGLERAIRSAGGQWAELRSGNDDTVAHVQERERLWASLSGERSPIAALRTACDLWCARWFTNGRPGPSNPELRATFDALLRGDRSLAPSSLPERMATWMANAREAADAHGFFHWPLEFADLFYQQDGSPRPRPGFHAVIGNPPWEMLRGGEDAADRRDLTSFIRGSGLYPACDRGHVNLYQPFLERSLDLTRPGGRVGLVLPWGLATDEGGTSLRRRLFLRDRVETIVGLDNGAGMFPIHRGLRFMVLVASPGASPRKIQARLGVRTAAELDELPGVDDPEVTSPFPLKLDAASIGLAGGPSLRIPDARTDGDLEWLTKAAARFPRLGDSPWNARFGRELNATEDSESFGPRGLPVMEGKHIAPFRVDLSTVRRFIPAARAKALLRAHSFNAPRLAYRDVAGVGNRKTLIAAIVPAGVVTTHTLFCLRNLLTVEQQHFLCALFNSAPLNRLVRMLMGGHVTTGLVEQLPVPEWCGNHEQVRLAELARELAATPPRDDETRVAMENEVNECATRLYS